MAPGGIGLAIASELAAEGCNVAMVAGARFELEDAAASVNKCAGGCAMAIVADVGDIEAITTAMVETEKTLGPMRPGLVHDRGQHHPPAVVTALYVGMTR